MRVRRTDRVAIGSVRRTAAGVLVVPASLSRTGLQTYRTHDGRERIEFRPESEVFAPAALESFKGAVVTIGHSLERNPKGVGLVSDRDPTKAVRDGESFVESSLMVTDGETIRRIQLPPGDPHRLVEISADYEADTDMTPGMTPDGRRYDARQCNISIHSIALLGLDEARAGREARIRLDGNEEICNTTHRPGSGTTHPEESVTEPKPIVKIKLDGKEFVEGSAEHIGHLNAALEASKAETAAANAKVAELTAKVGTETARADGLKSELDAAKANAPKAVADELAFRDSLASILPKSSDGKPYCFDGKDRTQIKRDAVGAEVCKRVDAQPEAMRESYLDGAVSFALDQRKSGTPEYPVQIASKTDATDVNPIAARSDKMFAEGRGSK